MRLGKRLYRSMALVGDDRLPPEYLGERDDEDPSFFREARAAYANATPEEKEKLLPFLVRPASAHSIFS